MGLNAKSIDTLIQDVQALFAEGHSCDPKRVEEFGQQLAKTVAERLEDYKKKRTPTLRMSNLGKPDRQVWYDLNEPEGAESLSPETKLTFMYGDILEALLLFLAKEAGHRVEHEQHTLEVDGIIGHTDAVIDGVVVDCKSASKYAFEKFKRGTLREDDPFGYYEQLAGYSEGFGGIDGAFWAIGKERGNMALLRVPREELASISIRDRITHLKEVVASESPPERCFDPVDFGKSGNLKLGINCSYCAHKFKCWSDANNGVGVRTFIYSDGPTHLVEVANEPRVPEVTF